MPVAEVLSVLVRPRVAGHGDWAVPLPKLAMPVRPDDMAAYTAQLAKAVRQAAREAHAPATRPRTAR